MQLAIVIMAAGKGTRLKSRRPKVLHEVGGKTLLRHVVDAARQIVPPEDIYVVVGHEAAWAFSLLSRRSSEAQATPSSRRVRRWRAMPT
jgi:bifunctional N-acetylglucosamine-1-phosphate-uridyltransferase/glucosamine-1-phosphate-acetyltransferase GlmU-like protein